MMKMPHSAGRWLRLLLGAAALSTLVADGGLRQDEIDCEEAVAYLQGCCPDFGGATITCVSESGCAPSQPALSVTDSQCIVARSCAEVIATGLCDATRNLQSPQQDQDGNFIANPPVCQ
jgi:hypothetical protein